MDWQRTMELDSPARDSKEIVFFIPMGEIFSRMNSVYEHFEDFTRNYKLLGFIISENILNFFIVGEEKKKSATEADV